MRAGNDLDQEDGFTVDHAGPCWRCGAPTNRVSIHWEAFICIGCEPAAWAEFFEADRRMAALSAADIALHGDPFGPETSASTNRATP